MRKRNFVFIGECVIVLTLLVLIAILVKDEKKTVKKMNNISDVVRTDVADEHILEDEIFDWQKVVLKEENLLEEKTVEANSDAESADMAENEDIPSELEEEGVTIVNTISDNNLLSTEEEKIKIVVFGDSIWDEGRGTDGISEQVMEQLDVEIYNCAIGGTTAAVVGESTHWSDWTSRSFNGMMYIATEIVNANQLVPNDAAYEVITEVDFDEIDYVIISYGLNDYFSDVPVHPQTYYDLTSYVGALRHGIQKLREEYPDMEFILTSPTYCEWFKGERQYELGMYVECARGVAQEMDVHFLDMYHALGKSPEEKMEFLSDGVHLTSEGRALYANSVIDFLKQLEE